MGYLYYGDSADAIDVPDLLLAHLKVVITTKLRRRESFTLSWRHEPGDTPGRSALWLQEAIPLRFVFSCPEAAELRPSVLHDFTRLANSTAGLTVDMGEWVESEEPAVVPSAA